MTKRQSYKKMMRVAKRIVIRTKNSSTSHLQRKMNISYNYADILMREISKLSGFRSVCRYRRLLY